jgi:hypothetical protein
MKKIEDSFGISSSFFPSVNSTTLFDSFGGREGENSPNF